MEKKLERKLDEIEIGPVSNGISTVSHFNKAQATECHQSYAMSDRRRALSQYCASGALSLLVITFGTTFGFITVIVAVLEELRKKDENFISLSQLTWMGSLNYVSVLIGTLFSGLISQWIGRRNALILSTFPYIASWILLFTCGEEQLWPIFLGVFLLGCCGGIIESPLQVYVAEISEPRLRGALSCSTGATFLIGIFLEIFVGKYMDWRTLALVSSSLPVLSLVSLSLVPESPYWLASKGRYEESLKALAWLRGWSPVSQLPQDEFREILSTISKKTNESLPIKSYFKRSAMIPSAFLCFIFFVGVFNGSCSILPWAISVFKEIHSPLDDHDTTIILTVLQFIGMVVMMITLPYTGRRMPTLASLVLSGLGFLVAALYIFFSEGSTQPNWLSTVAVLFAVCSSFLGIRHMPWILLGELLPTDVRSVTAAIIAIIDQIYAVIATKSYVYTKQTLTLPGTFLFFACVNFIGSAVLYFVMPETEGKSLAEIELIFSGRKVKKEKSVIEIPTQDP